MLKDIDSSYIKYKGTVAPAYGQISGAEEIAIIVSILSISDLRSNNFVSSILK